MKPAFHDADTDTDADILADILARIVARMSVSVSASWNSSLTARDWHRSQLSFSLLLPLGSLA